MIHLPKRIVTTIAATACLALGGVATAVVADGTDTTVIRSAATDRGAASAGAGALAGAPAGLPPTPCGTYTGRGCAPAARRVDTGTPTFSTPTKITNPLFPISRLRSVVLLGRVDGKPFRSETTLLPGTTTVVWNGKRIRVLLSQYTAFLGGHLDEVALDRYAQADDGSVWYLGEDVFDYRNGAVAITEGTWLAGRDGPAAMIMPGKPKVGDVFRPESITGVVFEEVAVKAVGRTVKGPHGPVTGALVAEELHLDGSRSDKTFAPGYGEFRTVDGGDVEALALAVPMDALPGSTPPRLRFLTTGAWGILENARLKDWEAASATVKRLNAAWMTVKAGAPPLIADRMNRTLSELTRTVKARLAGKVAQLAIGVAQSALDLELRHRPAIEVDIERFHLWTQQLRVHAAAGDVAGATGDVAVLEWIRDRVTGALDPVGLREIDLGLRGLRAASDARNLPAAADHAARLGAQLRRSTGARRASSTRR